VRAGDNSGASTTEVEKKRARLFGTHYYRRRRRYYNNISPCTHIVNNKIYYDTFAFEKKKSVLNYVIYKLKRYTIFSFIVLFGIEAFYDFCVYRFSELKHYASHALFRIVLIPIKCINNN